MSERVCPACGAQAGPDDRFCEGCGADLPRVDPPEGSLPAQAEPSLDAASGTGDDEARTSATALVTNRSAAPKACRECGGSVDADGYCTVCGAKAPRERDHLELRAGAWVGAVSDRGVRHHRNEDAAAVLAEGAAGSGRAALVVCDGVSSADDSDVASLAAARAAADALGTGSMGLADGGALAGALGRRVERAAAAAAAAVAAATAEESTNPPSCTFVAAAVHGRLVVVGVVGDSRAYWLPDGAEPVLLTEDDSVAGQQIAAGRPRAEAEAGPQAHALVRWIGVDSPDQTPRLSTLEADAPGWLLLCSDGLWNYCSEAPAVLAQLDAALGPAGGDPVLAAAAMVDWANAQGGHDNITVVLARLDPAGAAQEEGEHRR